jgi:hypothetical protein
MKKQYHKSGQLKNHPNFKYGTKVKFNNPKFDIINLNFGLDNTTNINMDNLSGNGKIIGIASNYVEYLGKSYIIELDNKIPDYDYTSIVCFEIFFEVIE